MMTWTKPNVEELNLKKTAEITGMYETMVGQVCPGCGKEWTGKNISSAHKGNCKYVGMGPDQWDAEGGNS